MDLNFRVQERLAPLALDHPLALAEFRAALPAGLEASSLTELGYLAGRPYFSKVVLGCNAVAGQYATQLRARLGVASLYGPESSAVSWLAAVGCFFFGGGGACKEAFTARFLVADSVWPDCSWCRCWLDQPARRCFCGDQSGRVTARPTTAPAALSVSR